MLTHCSRCVLVPIPLPSAPGSRAAHQTLKNFLKEQIQMCPGRWLGSQEGISTSWCPAAVNPEHAASWQHGQLPVRLRPCRGSPHRRRCVRDALQHPKSRAAAGTEGCPIPGCPMPAEEDSGVRRGLGRAVSGTRGGSCCTAHTAPTSCLSRSRDGTGTSSSGCPPASSAASPPSCPGQDVPAPRPPLPAGPS